MKALVRDVLITTWLAALFTGLLAYSWSVVGFAWMIFFVMGLSFHIEDLIEHKDMRDELPYLKEALIAGIGVALGGVIVGMAINQGGLEAFSKEIVPLLQLFVGLLGLLSLLLLWYQIKDAAYWNRLTSQYNFINTVFTLSLDEKVYEASEAIEVDLKARDEPLSAEEVQKLWENDKCYSLLIAYLNEYENLSVAIHKGIADPDAAYRIHSVRVLTDYKVYEPFIRFYRAERRAPTYMKEMETLHHCWRNKYDREMAENQ